ncbi:CPBP family intramembrane glutamic endopeptidase [Gynurincola endophyticus]|uniref:CPBP family intramembrane glutamic endopeptidase n=1 Tax=Gynurincola endophyticus TaxID=2479004 RepID=UPI000F8E6274|nr:CPBP family intramembrane glutamic endopeptidase [Gynurincola endophyticus]
MQISRSYITTGLLFVGVIAGFVLLNYTIPVIPYLLYFSFPVSTLLFWLFLCLLYYTGMRIQGFQYFSHNPVYVLLILLLVSLKVTIPAGFFSVKFIHDPHWQTVFKKCIHWGYKAVIPVTLYMVWRFYLHKPKKLSPVKNNQQLLIIAFVIVFIPVLFYLKQQPAFQIAYPKLKAIAGLKDQTGYWLYAFTFETFYLLDFVTIEVLFRGLLLQFFLHYKKARDYIIPMALVYGAIHLGKPLLECISSFFGGLLLGYLTYRTNEIYQGILIHVYIALAMELIMLF